MLRFYVYFVLLPYVGFAQESALSVQRSENIPYVASAGASLIVREGDQAEVYSIRPEEYGAVAGDGIDDTAAFISALEELNKSPRDSEAMIQLSAGVYDLSDVLWVGRSNVSIMGSGSDQTYLRFSRSLRDLFGLDWNPDVSGEAKTWSWRGGLIWAEVNPFSRVQESLPHFGVPISLPHSEGDHSLRFDPKHNERAQALNGKIISVGYKGNTEFLREIYGNEETFQDIDLSKWPLVGEDGTLLFFWHAKVVSVEHGLIHLDRPLRLPIKPDWGVVVHERVRNIRNLKIQGLTIDFDETNEVQRHLSEHGFNAIFMAGVFNSLVQDVVINNADNAFILEGSSFNTLRDIRIQGGRKGHHGATFRSMSHDNKVEDFLVAQPLQHGLSLQDLSSGNVYSKGMMLTGTFDLHRGMPFDNIRTEIVMTGMGRYGGAWGPLAGRRIVNWNIKIHQPKFAGKKINKSISRWKKLLRNVVGENWYPSGALVGIQGSEPQPDSEPWALPPGKKGCLVLSWGEEPNPPNLFEAQKEFYELGE